jgi:hypothetical protein
MSTENLRQKALNHDGGHSSHRRTAALEPEMFGPSLLEQRFITMFHVVAESRAVTCRTGAPPNGDHSVVAHCIERRASLHLRGEKEIQRLVVADTDEET